MSYFYNGHTRKVISLFGTLFANYNVAKFSKDGTKIDKLTKVPIRYGPLSVFMERKEKGDFENDKLYNEYVETFPKMMFEMTGMEYDASRQKTLHSKFNDGRGGPKADNPAPMILNFALTVAAKTQSDALQLVEQIIPKFRQNTTVALKHEIYDDYEHEIVVVLDTIDLNDNFEEYLESRVVVYTLNFSVWTHFWDDAGLTTNALKDFIECGGEVVDMTGKCTPVKPCDGDKRIHKIIVDSNDLQYFPDVDVPHIESFEITHEPADANSHDEVTKYITSKRLNDV